MAADHFCLRWNNYQSNMVTELDTLRSEEHLVDVTLSCEGQKFRAHKVILSACSAYFRNVFKENPCDHPVVILKDVSHEDVEALLSFVYQGVVYVSEKKLASFLQTAELLQIKGLTGAASSIKENHAGTGASTPEKGGVPVPALTPTWPRPNKSSASSSPTPPKRKKGTPVRIFKQNDGGGGDGSDTNSNNGCDDESVDECKQLAVTIKQELMDESDGVNNVHVSLSMDEDGDGGVGYAGSPGGGGGSGNEMRDDCGDSNSGGSGMAFGGSSGELGDMGMGEVDDDGEVKQRVGVGDEDAATLLERSLSGATVSRPFDLHASFSNFPIPAPGQGLPEQLTPADRLGRRPCPLCPKVISNKSNLLKHMRIRHSDEYNPAACMLCNKLFKNKYSLRAHFNIYHKTVMASNDHRSPPTSAAAPSLVHTPRPASNCTTPTS